MYLNIICVIGINDGNNKVELIDCCPTYVLVLKCAYIFDCKLVVACVVGVFVVFVSVLFNITLVICLAN